MKTEKAVTVNHFTETNVRDTILDRYTRLKELDYRELLKLSVDPKLLNFSLKPSMFEKFFLNQTYTDFVYYLISYCKTLLDIEKKQKQLEQEAKEKGLNKPGKLRKENEEIMKIGEKLSECYSAILIQWIQSKAKKPHLVSSMLKKENQFWEILILLTTKVCESYFEPQEFVYVDQELQRLVRTDTFNQSKRRHFEMNKLQKFPELANSSTHEEIDVTINRIMKRSQMPSINWKMQYRKLKSDIKPLTAHIEPFDAVRNRSTLLSFIAPTGKYTLNTLEKERKINVNNTIKKYTEPSVGHKIPTLIEKEMHKKGIKDDAYDIAIRSVTKSVNKSFY